MTDQLWKTLLLFKKRLLNHELPVVYCHISAAQKISINTLHDYTENAPYSILIHYKKKRQTAPKGCTEILLIPNQKLNLLSRGKLNKEAVSFLLLYLPYCFLDIAAKEKKQAQVVAHFAQTLDGKIATPSGKSRWIGNRQNLIHAHRMRALCDAVLIGKGTLKIDNPRLTVRHVFGENPIRIIIGNSFDKFNSQMSPKDAPIWLFGHQSCSIPDGFRFIQMKVIDNKINTGELLKKLFQLGIHTVYLEGGPSTTSEFLTSGNVSILQLHLSPMIFGSGQSAIQLPVINQLDEGVQFSSSGFYPIGDAIMFVGYL